MWGAMESRRNFTGAVSIVPPPPNRFTTDEWFLNNQSRYGKFTTNCQLVESIIDESRRICDKTLETTRANKNSTDRELDEKIDSIRFQRNELLRVRKEIALEIDALITYKMRLTDALASITRNAAAICQNCLVAREKRLGIDLTLDNVERELRKEYQVIQSAEMRVVRSLEQTVEQIRSLKSTLYRVDGDLENKDKNFQIDQHNLNLKETNMTLSTYHGVTPLDSSTITMQEWEFLTNEIIVDAKRQLNSGKILRNFIDTILKEVVDDLHSQIDATNDAFKEQISDTKEAKLKLELQHSEIIAKSQDLSQNIARLEKTLAEKEGFVALAHTRLGNRAQRPHTEMTSDAVERQLITEISDLRDSIMILQQTLHEAQMILRHVLKTQIQIEEDINVKVNTLKIDEVECMTMRQSLSFHAY